MFHAEMRMRLHQVRAFNLDAAQLEARLLAPLRAGEPFVYEDREWEPRKTRLTVFEAPELRPDQIGMGRGWANAEKLGTDVTLKLLSEHAPAAAAVQPAARAQPVAVDQLKERLIGRLSAGPVALTEITSLAAELMPQSDAQTQLEASHRAAAELLQQGDACLAPPSALAE